MAMNEANVNASAGHKLGQLIGDWFEEHLVLPLLTSVAEGLRLYLDHRFRTRPARGEKILWNDDDGNSVDYDFVMELDGSDFAIQEKRTSIKSPIPTARNSSGRSIRWKTCVIYTSRPIGWLPI